MSLYSKIFKYLFSEVAIALVFSLVLLPVEIGGIADNMDRVATPLRLLLSIGLLICSWRIVWNSALVIHGLGHVFTTAILDRNLHFISLSNVLENRSLAELLESCIPGDPIFLPWIASET